MNEPSGITVTLSEEDLFYLYNAARNVAGESRHKMESLKLSMAELRKSWKEQTGMGDDDFNGRTPHYYL